MRRALILGAVLVIGVAIAGSAQALTGHWRIDLDIDPQTASFVSAFTYSSELLVRYTIAGWTFSSLSTLDETGWTDQDFSASGVIGGFTFSSALSFDPLIPEFVKWSMTTTVEISGVTFSGTFELYDEDAFFTLQARGTAGVVHADATIKFGDDDDPEGECDLDFSSLQIGVDFPFCCAEVDSTTYFTCDGFEKVVFTTTGIALSNFPWVTFGATLEFTVDEKSLTITPDIDIEGVCFDFYVGLELQTDTAVIFDALHFDGFKLECDIGSVQFTAISFWGDFVSKPGILGEYWEMYMVEVDEDACCGPFDFEAAVFFEDDHVNLFDVGMFTFDMSIDFTPNLEFGIGSEYVIGVGVTKLTFSFLATW